MQHLYPSQAIFPLTGRFTSALLFVHECLTAFPLQYKCIPKPVVPLRAMRCHRPGWSTGGGGGSPFPSISELINNKKEIKEEKQHENKISRRVKSQ